jgi:two-component system sensor histidine kinase KdpD
MSDQWREFEQRPSPEALLEAARREESKAGRLKIFVGAAPGVGKTYEMLQAARAKRGEGVDVVVGAVETHGRKETEALLEGLEVIPRRRLEYRGQWLDEMDIGLSSRDTPDWCLSTSSRTPMRPAVVIPSVISMSRSC